MVALPFLAMVVALLLGVPIAVALGGSGLWGLWLVTGNLDVVIGNLGMMPYGTAANYVLSCAPMFILMAYLSSSSGLAKDLYGAASGWLSNIRGGLAIATVFACAVFGAMSGSSISAAAVMSNVAMPEMRRYKYSEELAAGAIGVGATLNILIPPSIAMVIYGLYTETSIGKLLIAGIFPGILVGIFLVLCIAIWVRINPGHAPKAYRASWSERYRGVLRTWPSLILIILIFTLLYTGIATPTEIGAIGAALAAVIGIAMGRLTWKGAIESFKGTIRTNAMIFPILIGANIFGNYVVYSQVPQMITEAVATMNINRWVVIAGIVVGYFVISMFMDEIPLLLITLQVTFPLVISLGFDPVWFGVMSMMMISMGLVFPPVGMIAFVVSATARANLIKVYKGTSILMIATILATIMIMIFPGIALWLPSKMR